MKKEAKKPEKNIVQEVELQKEIIELCIRGDKMAQYKLYRTYSKAMYNLCCRMMQSTEEAEDMLQESFADAFSKLKSFRFESTFGAWLKRLVINKCINELRRRKADLLLIDDFSYIGKTNDEPDTEESKLTVERVKKAMDDLPQGSKMIFSLYLLEGYDHKEISQILNISESTSKSQYMRARLRVKEKINAMIYE